MALWKQYLEMILGPFTADGMRYTIQSGSKYQISPMDAASTGGVDAAVAKILGEELKGKRYPVFAALMGGVRTNLQSERYIREAYEQITANKDKFLIIDIY